eukprot:3161-Heterococcus_DN1.PRE.1
MAEGLTPAAIAELLLEGVGNVGSLTISKPEYKCHCSNERVFRALRLLGTEAVNDILAKEETVECKCEFCGMIYRCLLEFYYKIAVAGASGYMLAAKEVPGFEAHEAADVAQHDIYVPKLLGQHRPSNPCALHSKVGYKQAYKQRSMFERMFCPSDLCCGSSNSVLSSSYCIVPEDIRRREIELRKTTIRAREMIVVVVIEQHCRHTCP